MLSDYLQSLTVASSKNESIRNTLARTRDRRRNQAKGKTTWEHPTRREVTPADTYASTLSLVKYLNNIPRVRASVVVETGSPAVIVKGTIFSRG